MTSPQTMLDVAVDEARKGLAEGGIPIGAALFSADGTLLGSGHNQRVQRNDPSIHAETDAFRNAGRQRGYRSTVMVTTLSPCWYCSGLVRQFNIGAVVIGESTTFTGGHEWLAEHGVEVTVLGDERCVAMMTDFIAAHPDLWAARSEGELQPGPETATGDPDVDRIWFAPNVWPAEVPPLQHLVDRYTAQMRRVADDLLALFAHALHLPANPFAALASRPTWTMNINHYPPVSVVGDPEPGQFRIGPHTDFGTVTILDREPGAGGLQVYSDAAGWEDAPYDAEALTVNIGELLEYWSGRRWPSGRHRVLPPQPHAPEEDLVSLIYFYEANHDAVVTPLQPPVGRVAGLAPVTSSEFIKERLDAITVA